MMSSSPFKKTFYFGLILILSPIFIAGIISLLIFVNKGSEVKKEKVIKEVTFPSENVVSSPKNTVEHDTVYVETPKPKIIPKVVVEPKKIDSVKVTDTFNLTN